MNDSKISVRYARALFESALEKKMLDTVYNDMRFILEVSASSEMKDLLKNPVIPASRKIEILNSALGKSVSSLTMGMINLVVRNGRETHIPAIARAFAKDTLNYKGITEAVLTTAVKIDPKIREQITGLISKISGTKVEMKEVIDKSIIGGFILKIDDSYLDASIRNKLNKIEKELKAGLPA
jgi:F-type H+-transporting ATPase subunit delta